MKKVRVLILAAVVAFSGVACTRQQKADFVCKVKFGKNTHAVIESNGEAGCYRISGAIYRVTCQEDMKCWDCKTMGNLVCGPVK